MAGFKPRVISLTKRPGQSFGFYLRVEHGEEGHLIRSIEMGGPAELAGIKDGDRMLRVNGNFVDEMAHSEVVDIVRNSGASVTFHILDEASYKQAKAQGVNLSNTQHTPVANGVTKHSPKPKLCYMVQPSSSYGFSLRTVRGEPDLFMSDVIPGSVAHKAGVKVDDHLLEVNGENVEDLSHDEVVDKIKAGSSLMFLLADDEAYEYYKNKRIKIGASLATVEYLPHKPRVINITQGSDGYGFLLSEEPKLKGHFIRDIDRGSPAETSGMKEMDRLVAIDGYVVDDCNHEQVVDRIRQSGNRCCFLVVDKDTDQMCKLGKLSPMLFYDHLRGSISPPSYKEAITLPSPVQLSSSVERMREELKPKLCKLEKTSAGYGFHLNGIEGVCGQYIKEVVRGGAADRAGLKDDDIVVEVNGVNVEQSSHRAVVEMIRTSGDSLELLVAERSVYKELKKKGVIITGLLLEEASYVQVHSANNYRPGTPTEGPRERSASSLSEESIDVRL